MRVFSKAPGFRCSLSGSFGLATYPEDGDTVPTILRSADTMMYEAKTTRDNVAVVGKGLLMDRARCGWGRGRGRLSPGCTSNAIQSRAPEASAFQSWSIATSNLP